MLDRVGQRPPQFAAFISYKHGASSAFSDQLEIALKAYAKPLFSPPRKIFRDEKHLAPGMDLPRLIRDALESSGHLILLGSKGAAESPWVRDEMVQWCGTLGRKDRLILVLTEPGLVVDPETKTIDWSRTTVLPPVLRQWIEVVPLYVDLSWASSSTDLSLVNARFKQSINAISARMLGVDPNEMLGEEVRQHRRTIRIRNAGVALLAMLTVAAVIAAVVAWRALGVADTERNSAIAAASAEAVAREQAVRAAEAEKLARGQAVGAAEAEKLARKAAEEAAEKEKASRKEAEEATKKEAEARSKAEVATDRARQRAAETLVGRAERERQDANVLRETALLHSALEQHDTSATRALLLDAALRTPTRVWEHGTRCNGVTAFSPDSARIAIGCTSGAVEIWNVKGPHLAIRLQGHSRQPTALSFDHSGRRLATAATELRVWDVASGKMLFETPERLAGVGAVGFSAEDQKLVCTEELSPGSVNSVRLWEPNKPGPGRRIPVKGSMFVSSAISPDGRWVAYSHESDVALWSIDREAPGPMLKGDRGQAKDIAFSPDGMLVAARVSESMSRLWNLKRAPPAPVHEMVNTSGWIVPLSADRVAHLASDRIEVRSPGAVFEIFAEIDVLTEPREAVVSPDGRWLATGARLYDGASQYQAIEIGQGHGGPVSSVAFDAKGERVLSASQADGTVAFWRADTGQRERLLPGVTWAPPLLSPDGRALVLQWNLDVFGYDLHTGQWMAGGRQSVPLLEDVQGVGIDPSARFLLYVDSSDTVRRVTLPGDGAWRARPDGIARGAAVDPLGRSFAEATRKGLRVYPLTRRDGAFPEVGGGEKAAEPRKWKTLLEDAEVMGTAFSPDGRWLAASDLESVHLWTAHDLVAGPVLSPPGKRSGDDLTFAFAPDGERMAIAFGGRVTLWALSSRSLLSSLELNYPATSVAWSPDGRLLAIGGRDGLSEWRLDGVPEGFLLWGASATGKATFSPDGKHLLAEVDGGGVRVWDVATRRIAQDWHMDRPGMVAWWDSSTVAVGTGLFQKPAIRLFNPGRLDPVSTIEASQSVGNLYFRVNGSRQWLATAIHDHDNSRPRLLQPWDMASRAPVPVQPRELQGVYPMTSFALHPTEPLIAIAGFDETIRVWSFKTGTSADLVGHTSSVSALNYAPSGDLLSIAADGVLLWKEGKGPPERVATPPVRTALIGAGSQIVLVGLDGAVWWMPRSNSAPMKMPVAAHAGKTPVSPSVDLSPDGRWLAIASGDSAIWILDLPQIQRFFSRKGTARSR